MKPNRLAGMIDGRRFWVVVILLWVAWLFAPCLLGSERLAFRDVSHFYLPLYSQLGERFADGGLPLWNPWDRFGIPVAGETTTAIFYPPRLLFSSGIPADYAMTLYVVGHLLLAGIGAYWVARKTLEGAGVASNVHACLAAAVIYPAAGPVFFLYTNPPFLVGAAWLPWAVGGLLRAIDRPSLGSIAVASIALAMAILGGDPQLAFHTVLFSGGYWAVRCLRTFWARTSQDSATARSATHSQPAPTGPALESQPQRPRVLPLVACVLVASGLASLQIFAGAAWSLQSWRQASQPESFLSQLTSPSESPPHLPPQPAEPTRDQELPPFANSTRPAAPPRHLDDIYDYSVAPWHWAEFASPFVSGRLFPVNGRLTQLIPGEPRIWTLTLYAGLLPLLCLLAGPLNPRRWTVWHALVLVGLLLSLGDFAPARFLRGCLESVGLAMPEGISDAAGGGYWGLVNFIPGYGQFRYPAKWLPFASLGMAVWTAMFLSRCDTRSVVRAGRVAWAVGAVALATIAVTWLPGFRDWLAERASAGDFADSFWGPLDIGAGLHSLRFSLVIAMLLAAGYGILFRGNLPLAHSRVITVTLAILIADLALSTSWQLASVERSFARREAPVAPAEPADSATPRRFLSTAIAEDWPPRWRLTNSADRLREVEAAQREVWFMRWHLADSAAVVNSAVSIASTRSTLFWEEARRYALALPSSKRRVFIESLHRFIGIEASFDRRISPRTDGPPQLHFAPTAESYPLVRWHSGWQSTKAAASDSIEDSNDVELISRQLRSLFMELLQRQEKALPRVESSKPAPPPAHNDADANAPAPSAPRVTLLAWQPERVRVRVDAPTAGLVTLQQLQDGFWRARLRPADEVTHRGEAHRRVQWKTAKVYRVDVVAQGVFVPQGQHVLEFYYRPTWLLPGMVLTGLTIAGLAVCGLVKVWRDVIFWSPLPRMAREKNSGHIHHLNREPFGGRGLG